MANEVTNEVYVFEKSASGSEVFRIDYIEKELSAQEKKFISTTTTYN
ncbi:MAG: hypothetical protein KAH32_03860 [Chlamydiia bacterium]|nr:hypothetical protein [Chlamydiia bacterium]